MTKSAEVVIVGGGIVGSSIAYHLTNRGCSNVLVLEREVFVALCHEEKTQKRLEHMLMTGKPLRN